MVVNCIGLARAHETDTGRAVLAVFLPVILCCGLGFVILFMAGGTCGTWITIKGLSRADRPPATCSRRDQSRTALAKCFLRRAGPGGNVARSEIAVADMLVSCANGSSLSDLRRDAIGRGIFSRALFRGVSMESARIPFLLCAVDLQPLCAGRDRHASAAGANSGTDRGRAKIYPRRNHRPICLELDLSVDR